MFQRVIEYIQNGSKSLQGEICKLRERYRQLWKEKEDLAQQASVLGMQLKIAQEENIRLQKRYDAMAEQQESLDLAAEVLATLLSMKIVDAYNDALHPQLSWSTYHALRCAKIDTLRDLVAHRASELLEKDSMDEATLRTIVVMLRKVGLSLRPEETKAEQQKVDEMLG